MGIVTEHRPTAEAAPVAAHRGGGLVERAARLVREHWVIALVLALGLLVRIGVAVAYRPALFFSDSWAYLGLAYEGDIVRASWDFPSGYPLLMQLLAPGRSLATLTTLQHLAGLVTGVVLYVTLLRLSVPRWAAALGAAVVALDGYAIALEQHIMPEAFFMLAVLLAGLLAVGRGAGIWSLAAAGALTGAAVTVRPIALFVLPVFLAYVVWRRPRVRVVAAVVVAVALPLLAHAAVHAHYGGNFGLTQADGWLLYGRVGEIAECGGADVPDKTRPLCRRRPIDARRGALFHVWNDRSLANRLFGGRGPDWAGQARSNRLLREHALAIIADRPARYLSLVAGDLLRYFSPGVGSRGGSDLTLALPERPRTAYFNETVRDRHIPRFVPQVHPPAETVRALRAVVHTPRWLLAALALAALVLFALSLARSRRGRLPHRPEVFLFTGSALAMLVGSAATVEFELRYLVPAAPLLVAGGLVALSDWQRTAAARPARGG